MSNRSVVNIDLRIERLKILLKRMRAERRVAILREKHRAMKLPDTGAKP